ncbi:MAG TPA: flagellar basal body rod protein FlgB [Firmicutes bacterium]|jgi:flagellar basal-body rod protein FlgB|nr:flagellar basal body rod protein FlgB [Bacillota bacterium]
MASGLNSFRYTSAVLERTLDALGLRQRVTAHNVANVNTPGYKPLAVSFEAELRKALQIDAAAGGKNPQTATRFTIGLAEGPGAGVRIDGNAVDIDKEMVTTAKTTLAYQAVTQQWSDLYGRLRMAVREGRR